MTELVGSRLTPLLANNKRLMLQLGLQAAACLPRQLVSSVFASAEQEELAIPVTWPLTTS